MTTIAAYPSGVTNSVDGTDRTFVEPPELIGWPEDAPATDVTDENSAFALVKGMLVSLGLTTGAVQNTNNSRQLYNDPMATLGSPEDVAATDTGTHSAISMLKGILVTAEAL